MHLLVYLHNATHVHARMPPLRAPQSPCASAREHDVKGFARRKEERQSKINININVGRQPNKQTNNASTDGNIPYARIEGPDCASIHREIEVRIRQHHAGELETATTVYNMYEEKEETAGQHKVVGQGKEEKKEETAGQDTVVGEEKGNATKATQSKDGTGPEGAREQKAGDKETGREVWPIAQPRTLASNYTPTHRYLTESRTPHRHPIESVPSYLCLVSSICADARAQIR